MRFSGFGEGTGRGLAGLWEWLRGLWQPWPEARPARGASERVRGGASRAAATPGGRGLRSGAGGAGLSARESGAHQGGARPMSAVLAELPQLQPMREADLDDVMAIETSVYSHPWSRGNFADSLRAGYDCLTS